VKKLFVTGLVVSIVLSLSVAGEEGRQNEIEIADSSDSEEVKAEGPSLEALVFYRKSYQEFIDSKEIEQIANAQASLKKMKGTEKMFFVSGFVRGLIDYSTFENYKKDHGLGLLHFHPQGHHIHIERIGWQEGCKVGKEKGDLIIKEYSMHLKRSKSR
jgi:hypothetical protein